MNILYLVGNGFDLNLGMKTSYNDFYKYYSSLKSKNSLIQKLKDEIDGHNINWSDLELALGDYTKYLNSTEEFNEVYEDIQDNLADYLSSIEKGFDYNQFDTKRLKKYFAFPEDSLPSEDKIKINEFKRSFGISAWNIDVITFNYTKSLEILLDYKEIPIRIDDFSKLNTYRIKIQKIEHIHGFIEERMVMGVNDISQVSNKKFHTNLDVIETIIKSDCNQAQKHTIDKRCKDQISKANLICIFGSSIGDTDNLWWQLIGEQLKRNCILIIFEKCELIPTRRPQKGVIAERRKKNYFLNKTNLNEQEKETLKDKIFVGVNTDMFNLKLSK